MAAVNGSAFSWMATSHMGIYEGVVRWVLCVYFLAAAAAAAAASRWPTFAYFAAHGKVRQHQKQRQGQGQQQQQQPLQQTPLQRFLRWLEAKDCSKLRFIDFYVVGVLVSCCCLLSLQQQQQQGHHQQHQQSNRQLLPLTLLLLHLLRRLGEQALLVASSKASRMHVFAYILGCT